MEKYQKIKTLSEQYVITNHLGSGSFAQVWTAIPINLFQKYASELVLNNGLISKIHTEIDDASIAVKIFSPKTIGHQELRSKFDYEAEKLKGLEHKNIVKVYDHNPDAFLGESTSYYTMEKLCENFGTQMRGTSELSLKKIINTILNVGDALSYVYNKGITAHADIHPGNILISKEGVAKLSDFGMALENPPEPFCKQNLSISAKTMLTYDPSEEIILARNNFTAPELREGRVKDATPMTDIYSLGVILAQCLEGLPKRIEKGPLYNIVDKATRYIPSRRFDSMTSFVQAIDEISI
ncbi:MAG: serine/threonine-protein kinase [Candidatus Woesearchaeota archaeon]